MQPHGSNSLVTFRRSPPGFFHSREEVDGEHDVESRASELAFEVQLLDVSDDDALTYGSARLRPSVCG